MDDTKQPIGATPGQAGQPQQQIQIQLDATNRETVYVNFTKAHLTNDEVYLDVGNFSQMMTGAGAVEPVALTHRLIMNFYTAKRLSELLRAAVASHEQMFGAVELDPQRRLRQPPQRPAGT
jgi:hypothetical protein